MPAINGRILYQTRTFSVVTPLAKPHIPREEGGHLMICATEKYFPDRTAFSPAEAIEMMRLSVLTAEAFPAAMAERGITIDRINFQENGNWAFLREKPPVFHLHLYARKIGSKSQTWGEALFFPDPHDPRYESFAPLTEEDCAAITAKMDELAKLPRFAESAWGL